MRTPSKQITEETRGGECETLDGERAFMKILSTIISAFLLVGCSRSHQSAALTAEQARSLAIKLANDKALALYHCQPFLDGQPAQFVAGHWIWTSRQGFGHGDVHAKVELAADGSTHDVDVKLFENTNPIF